MKNILKSTAPIAAMSLTLLCPAFIRAQNANDDQNQNSATQRSGMAEAREMVRADVALTRGLDAKKDQDGSQFTTRLEHTVHLKNGPELPKGTILLGKVTADDMNEGGKSKLALRFTEAKLKDGNTVPIRATVVELYPMAGMTSSGEPIPEDSAPTMDADSDVNQWNPQTLKVDQIGAMKNVDMHSSVKSQNSAVFVSSKSNDVKVMQGSQLELALSAQGNIQQGQGGNSR